MDVLAEIKQKLISGKKPVELVKEGYAKSSVYSVAKKVRNVQSVISEFSVGDELTELRRQKEIIKLQSEIAELEAAKEKLPERMVKLEAEVVALRSLVRNAVDTALFISMVYANRPDNNKLSEDGIKDYSDDWVERIIEKAGA